MITVPLSYYIGLSVVLFAIGAIGVAVRRNALIVLMSLEIMMNAVNLAFISFARFRGDAGGHGIVFVVIAVAAAEVAVGLALAIRLFKHRGSVYVDEANQLKY
jgi:NADH-quinone oxidoreductase subunit K